jgi:hypothetical protein
MEMWVKQAEAEKEAGATKPKPKATGTEECTFMPHVNHRIPNFKALQSQFQEALEKNKRMHGATAYVARVVLLFFRLPAMA